MLSSDKNIETITQLVEMVKHNFELRKEYAKLDVVSYKDDSISNLPVKSTSVVLSISSKSYILFSSK